MSRLLAASGDPDLAQRVLQLYIQVVSKAREAATSDREGSEPSNLNIELNTEFDTSRQWVQTLVQGSNLLCKSALQEPDYGKSNELAKEAGTVLEKARKRLDWNDKELAASLYLAEGVWHSVAAYTGTVIL